MIYKLITCFTGRKAIAKFSLLLSIALICGSQSAQASFTDDLTIGNATALGFANAVTADPPGIDSIHYNPAGLARLKGRQMFIKGVSGIFSSTVKFGEYGEYQKQLLDSYRPYFSDANGNLTPEGQKFLYDDAYGKKSSTEGPTVMLPGAGMVNLPVAMGAMGGASFNPPGSKFTFATNVYAPMMMGFHRAKDDPGRYFQQAGAFTLITYFSPSIGYEVSDELSLGLAVNFSYSGMGMDLPTREPHPAIFFANSPFIQGNFCEPNGAPLTEQFNVCGIIPPYTVYSNLSFEASQPDAVGFNLGMLWNPEPWLTLGMAYNSRVNTNMNGTYKFPIDPNFKQFLINFMSGSVWQTAVKAAQILGAKLPTAEEVSQQSGGKINIKYQIPQRFNVGLSVQLTPRWKYNLDLKWTEWSAFSNIGLNFGEDVPLLELGAWADQIGTGGKNGISANSVRYQLGLKNTSYWAMGTEYKYSDQLSFRAGVEDRPSAVPKDHPNAFIPMTSGYLYSLGMSYITKNDHHWDFAMGYFHTQHDFPPCSAQLGNGCNPYNVVFAPYQGEDIKSQITFLLFEVMYSKHF